MSTVKQQISDLAALLQIYLLQEYKIKDWKVADQDSYKYFKEYVQQQKKVVPPKEPQTITVSKTASSPVQVKAPAPTNVPPPQKIVPQPPEAVILAPQEKSKPAPVEQIANTAIELHPLTDPQKDDLNDVKKIILERIPSLQVIENIPDDTVAKAVRQRWLQKDVLSTVVFLSFQENEAEAAFLVQVMSAVKKLLAPANILKADSLQNEELLQLLLNAPEVRCIVASFNGLKSKDYLWKYFKGDSNHLGQKPVLLLEDLSVYMQDQQKKAALWRSLQGLFK